MRFLAVTLGVIVIASDARAGGIELNKDAVAAYPPDTQGVAAISGSPGCVIGLPPVYVTARNKESGMTVNASARSDGSFSVGIPARERDTVKLIFFSRDGKKKDISVRIPDAGDRREAGARKTDRAEVNVDLGPFAQFGAPEVVQVGPDGRGGTRVHVGRRPAQPPAAMPVSTAPLTPEAAPGQEGTRPAPVEPGEPTTVSTAPAAPVPAGSGPEKADY